MRDVILQNTLVEQTIVNSQLNVLSPLVIYAERRFAALERKWWLLDWIALVQIWKHPANNVVGEVKIKTPHSFPELFVPIYLLREWVGMG
jgi:hypothetical protein